VASQNQQPTFSNDAEIIILDESAGTIDRTRRPVSEASRKRILKQLELEAELRREMEEERSKATHDEGHSKQNP
jgi:hypothetical protein